MKKIIVILLFTNLIFGQESTTKRINFRPEFRAAFTTKHFFGDNYLAKGHKNPGIGGIIKLNILEYYNFKIGGGIEKSTIQAVDFAIGGNVDKTNINAVHGILSYQIPLKAKLVFEPQLSSGLLELRQKSGRKHYGTQTGFFYGFGFDIVYQFNKGFAVFSSIEYAKYQLKTNTSPEFKNYFNNSNLLNISVGIKL